MKKNKVFKVILTLILALICFYIIFVIRNFIILVNIAKQSIELRELSSYYYKVVNYDENNNVISTSYMYKKDGISKIVNERLIWANENTSEQIFLDFNTKESTVTSTMGSVTVIPTFVYGINLKEILRFSTQLFIETEKVDDIKCYKININSMEFLIEKDTGLVLKMANDSGTTEYRDWRLNEVTDEEVARPDLTGYVIKNGSET